MTIGILALAAICAIDLGGEWQVTGEGFAGTARLPGTLAKAQLGKRWTERDFQTTMDLPQSEALVQEWQYAGKAVWTRTVIVGGNREEGIGNREEGIGVDDNIHSTNYQLSTNSYELFLERVMWTSAAYWDGQPLGTRDSLATPHVYALPALTPGKHELRIEIDNGNHYNFSRQSHAYGPNMQAIWNGVLGKVEIRRAHPLRQARVFASYPANGILRVEVPAACEVDEAVVEELKRSRDQEIKGSRDQGFKRSRDQEAIGNREEVEKVKSKSEKVKSKREEVKSVELKTSQTSQTSQTLFPSLITRHSSSPYRPGYKMLTFALPFEPKPWCNEKNPALYLLTLKSGDYEQRIRFGFRTLGTKGHAITLNGNKIFARGNVENANFAVDGTPWMTKGEWARMLMTLRDEDGVDTIRFHTWCPPAAAFEAAEELGMFLQPEAGIWTDGWMSEGDEIGNGKPVDGFVRRELKQIVDAYGNSPAFLSLSIGNELGNSNFQKMGEMIAELRAYDPRALYYASSARKLTDADDFLLTHRVAGRTDLYGREVLKPRTDWDYEDNYSKSVVPSVAHEIGEWPVYPIWDDLLKPFTGTMRPWNLSRHYDTAAKKNALRFQREYHAASAKLNRLIYKEEVESFLRTPSCAGLQLLEVQDYTGQAEALVGWRGPFYDLKAGFRDLPPFSTVWGPISYLARIPKFTWQVGETFRAELEIRNLTQRTLAAGTEFVWTFGGAAHPVKLAADVAPGEVAKVAVVEIPLTEAMTRAKQTVFFGMNRWNFWVYPREEKCAVPAGVVVTKDVAAMKQAIAEGKTVLYTGPSWKSAKGQFKSVYWSARWFPVANTTSAALGTWFDVKHPALAGFVTDDFTDWQWYTLAEGATIHALRGMPADYRPIALTVNDFHFSDFTSTMFEVQVGKGRLFVCGYDLEADTPEARRLRASVFAYLGEKGERVERGENSILPTANYQLPTQLPLAWLAEEFDAAQPPDLSGAVYDCKTNWVGRTFKLAIRNVPPTTGEVVVDFFQPEKGLTSGRGTLDDHVFEVPFTQSKGARTSAGIPVIREDFLDGKLELEINLMTGAALGVDRIRIVPKQ